MGKQQSLSPRHHRRFCSTSNLFLWMTALFVFGYNAIFSNSFSKFLKLDGREENSSSSSSLINLSEAKKQKPKHAMIVPYHSSTASATAVTSFQRHMQQYLQKHFPGSDFSVLVVEQVDSDIYKNDSLLNAGWLINVGLQELLKTQPGMFESPNSCITIHNINIRPNLSKFIPYTTCPAEPVSLHYLNKAAKDEAIVRGVFTLRARQWKKLQGLSNHGGWRGQWDLDLYDRLQRSGISKDATLFENHLKPSTQQSMQVTFFQSKRSAKSRSTFTKSAIRKLLSHEQRYQMDGLTDLRYTLVPTSTPHHIQAHQDMLLEFVHVPKTGGSAIEKAAANANLAWGACHFFHDTREAKACPDPANYQPLGLQSVIKKEIHTNTPIWHVPPQFWNVNMIASKRTFTVVRNPFDRAVSIYYDPWFGFKGSEEDKAKPSNLNHHLQQLLANGIPAGVNQPQADFVYDANGNRLVDHVIEYKSLATAFAQLMVDYNLPKVRLEGKPINPAQLGHNTKLTADDLDNTTVKLIQQHFAKDFDLLGLYERRIS